MYKKLTPRAANRLTSGGQIVTVATTSKEGVADIMTAAWNTPYDSDQVLVVLDRGHTTTKNIIETGKFVVAIPHEGQIADINRVGSIQGRDSGDKFAWAKITPVTSEVLGIKTLPDALAYIECELVDLETLKKTGVCIGKAVNITVKEELWDEEHSSFAAGFAKTLHYISEDAYYTNGKIVRVEENFMNMTND